MSFLNGKGKTVLVGDRIEGKVPDYINCKIYTMNYMLFHYVKQLSQNVIDIFNNKEKLNQINGKLEKQFSQGSEPF